MKSILPVAAVAGTVICGAAHAATYCYWVGPNGGEWSNAANWKNGRIPTGAGDVARLSTTEAPDCGTLIALDNPEALTIDRIEALAGEWTIQLGGTLSLQGADKDHPTVQADNASVLTFDGGVLDGVCYRAAGTSQIRFHNCANRAGMNYRRSTIAEGTGYSGIIDSGVNAFRTWFARMYEKYKITGGLVTVGSFHGGDQYGEGKMSRLTMPLEVTGGKFKIDGADTTLGTNSGLGIDAKGNAVVEIVPGGNQIWMADRQVKTWRVSEKAWIKAPGPYMATGYNNSTATIEVVGGRFQLQGDLGGKSGSTDDKIGRRSEMLLNGGVLDIDYASSGNLSGSSVKDEVTGHFLMVGANGGRIRNRNNITLSLGSFMTQQGLATDGGMTYDGLGTMNLTTSSTYVGGTTVRAPLKVSATSGALGTGAVTLKDGGMLTVPNAGTALPALTVVGQGVVEFSAATAALTVPSLTHGEKGVLVVDAGTNYDKVGKDRAFLSLESVPALRTDGLFEKPVFLFVSGYNNSAKEMHLAMWDGTNNRIIGATYTEGWGDENSVSYVTEGGYMSSRRVGALVLRGGLNGGSGWNTLTIGDGTGNAYLCMNAYSNGKWAQIDNAYVAFGTAHGVIAVGTKVSGVDSGTPYINAFITGSAGVTFVGADGSGLRLYRPQDYTGGTQVLGGELMMQSDSTLGTDVVEVSGGESRGGCVRFLGTSAFVNDFTLSGFGTGGAAKKGALSFESETTLSGQVTLTNDAMICAVANKTGTFSKAIKGTGDLYLGGEGTIAIPGIDVAGDVHVDGNVTTAGGILTDGRFLFVEGTLTFENDADITVDAKVLGAGKIVLAGTGKVDFSDLSVFDGTIDLCGRDATIGALYGLAKVTNSVDSAVTLTVSGTSESAYFGTIPDGISLTVGGKFLLGPTAALPATAALTLDGGTIGLGAATTLAALSGDGTVSGQKLTVTGAVTPTEFDPGEVVLSFGRVPEFQAALDKKWRLKTVGLGAELVKRRGAILIVR